jgi:DNA-binding NarL/FixJ family response regulator
MRIVVADEQAKVRYALKVRLRQRPGLDVVGEAASVRELLAEVKRTEPDVVLLHWRLRKTADLDLVAALRDIDPGLHVIALSALPDACIEALDEGADAFVSKVAHPQCLLEAIHAAGPPEGTPSEALGQVT